MSKPVFLYFGLTGRVPAARIALFAAFGKDGWVDEIMDFPSFGAEKKKLADGAADAKLVSGSLPQLTLPSGKTVLTLFFTPLTSISPRPSFIYIYALDFYFDPALLLFIEIQLDLDHSYLILYYYFYYYYCL